MLVRIETKGLPAVHRANTTIILDEVHHVVTRFAVRAVGLAELNAGERDGVVADRAEDRGGNVLALDRVAVVHIAHKVVLHFECKTGSDMGCAFHH